MHKALLYDKCDSDRVICHLCAHGCSIANHKRGLCGVRENIDGELYTLVYGRIVAENVDPVEKKPLFHFLPGSKSFSISTVGCNFSCRHCQNFSISQPGMFPAADAPGNIRSPEQIVNQALMADCRSISYTYVEPTIFLEFALDCMQLAHEQNIKNIFVSNGYMGEEATALLVPLLDGINIDLKSFSNEVYKSLCGAKLQPVLDSIKRIHDAGVWVEVTTLLIPGLNDSSAELREIAGFIASVDCSIPWHVTGFYPTYKLTDRPPTPVATIEKARRIGIESGLHYVYAGNRPGSGGENTSCPSCSSEVILRHGFSILKNRLVNGCCPECSTQIAGVWA